MSVYTRTFKKSILTFIALSVFFWTAILPAHFHPQKVSHSCSCHYQYGNKQLSDISIISENVSEQNEDSNHCPLCALSSMFSIGLIVEEHSSILTFLNDGTLPYEFLSYSFNGFKNLKARAPPIKILA